MSRRWANNFFEGMWNANSITFKLELKIPLLYTDAVNYDLTSLHWMRVFNILIAGQLHILWCQALDLVKKNLPIKFHLLLKLYLKLRLKIIIEWLKSLPDVLGVVKTEISSYISGFLWQGRTHGFFRVVWDVVCWEVQFLEWKYVRLLLLCFL